MLVLETLKDWILEKKKSIMFGAFILIGIFGLLFFEKFTDTPRDVSQEEDLILFTEEKIAEDPSKEQIDMDEANTKMMVDVKGAVKNPGVYDVKEGERIIDVINRAGGFIDEADVNQMNLSERVADEMVIYVPKIGEETAFPPIKTSSNQDQGQININQADKQLLETLPGIGPSKAEAIVQYREENGPFQEIEELMNISGIGEKTFEKIKDSITVR